MNSIDLGKIEALRSVFNLNYKLTELYAAYLNHCPELITEAMVKAMGEDSDLSKKDILVAILCEAFGLDYSRGAEDRKLIRDYLIPSVKMLDADKYRENKYYKNIRIPTIKDGSWELRTEFYPPYRAVICGDMELLENFSEIPPLAFFEQRFDFPAVLEDGNEWMTLTPVDLDTCEAAIEAAHGRVITFGLGLGYYAYMVSEKENVESVTVVERSEAVIRLFKKHILPQFSHGYKIKIINTDAFEYAEHTMPKEKFDYAFVDIWRDASDGAPIYKKFKPLEKLSPKIEFSYWIEGFLVSRLRSLRFEELYASVKYGAADAPKSYNEFIERLKEYGCNT